MEKRYSYAIINMESLSHGKHQLKHTIILFFVWLRSIPIFPSVCRDSNTRQWLEYECLVESCGLKFKNYKSRQQHLVDKHKFPTSFEFFKKVHPSEKQWRKNQRKQSLHNKEASSTIEVEDETVGELVSAVAKLSTSDSTPSSVSFGRGHTGGLTFIPRAVQHERKQDSTSVETK